MLTTPCAQCWARGATGCPKDSQRYFTLRGGRLSRAGGVYNETWEVHEALTSSLWATVAWKHFLEMANQLEVVAQGAQWWWAVDLGLWHTWLQHPVIPLTQALSQVNCGFLIYKLGVNTSHVLRQIMRIQWPIRHLQKACHIYGVNKCSILSAPCAWTKFILVTKSIPFSTLEECIWDIGAAMFQKGEIRDSFWMEVPGHKSNLLSSPDA